MLGGSRTPRFNLTHHTMEAFEDENPFEAEGGQLHSETSSPANVNFSEPSSPPTNAYNRVLSPQPGSPSVSKPTFPSPGSHRLPQPYKSDYCCARDHWLHSGEDVEILVRLAVRVCYRALTDYSADHRRTEDFAELDIAIHHLHYQVWGTYHTSSYSCAL